MTIPTWATPFSDNTSTIGATFLNNYVRTQLPKCLDGVGGSDGIPSTPTTKLQIYGLGLELGGATAPRLKYESRTIVRAQPPFLYNSSASTWSIGSASVGAAQLVVQECSKLPNGATLTSVRAYHNRPDSGSFPVVRVTVQFKKRNIVTGTTTSIAGPTEDATAILADYYAHHAAVLTIPNEVIDTTTNVYWVEFTGEDGGSSQTTVFSGCTCVFTVTEQDEAP